MSRNGVRYAGKKTATFKKLAERDPDTLNDLRVFLNEKIHDVNNNLLKNNDIHNHVVVSNDTGLDVTTYTNYKEYLLAPREDDSDIPYTTNIASQSSASNTDAFQFKGGYLTFNVPSRPAPKKEKPTTKSITG